MNSITTIRLAELEVTIEQGFKTFIDVGNALLEIRDSRLYRENYATFEGYCQERWGFTRRRASQLISAAGVIANVNQGSHSPPVETERQARPLTRLEPERQIEAWQTAVETAPNGKVTAAHVESVVRDYLEPVVDHRPHVSNNSGNNEWYTPAEYIEAARSVMGSIDLDPATSEAANEVVRANSIYTIDNDGLSQPWFGNVWLNPPYANELISGFIERVCFHFGRGEVTQAVVLVNNATETAWFQQLADQASVICFPKRRVKFWKPGGDTGAPLQGQAILYLGGRPRNFSHVFSEFGFICNLTHSIKN